MKYILVIPDGMGDTPIGSLGDKTPLEAAQTPNMDFFASHGTTGLSCNIPEGFVPGTDIGCLSVFGYNPAKYFTGRGPLEAAELGIELKSGQMAFRCNLVTTDAGILKDFCADHISTGEAKTLLDALDSEIKKEYGERVRFYAGRGTGYRNLMVYQDTASAMKKVRCTPPHDIMGKPYGEYLPREGASEVLIALMERSKTLFAGHPVNRRRIHNGKGPATMVWLWGGGFPPSFPSYYEKYKLRGGVITAVDLVRGIAIYAGLDLIRVPGVTGFFDTNYVGKAEYAVNALRSRDFVAIHVESTDEAGHMGDPALKIKAIEDIDRLVLGTLRAGLEEFAPYRIMILPDHCTLAATRTHSSDPVPFIIYDSNDGKKGLKKFCEKTAGQSGLFVPQGHELMTRFTG